VKVVGAHRKPLELAYYGHHPRGGYKKPQPSYWECMRALERAYGEPEERPEPPEQKPVNLEEWE
jgi:hypothetical protein